MFTYVLLAFCVIVTAVNAGGWRPIKPPPQVPYYGSVSKIVGANADIKEHPYQLSLEMINRHHCSATLLNSEYAITTAQCNDMWLSNLSIRGGSPLSDMGGQSLTIAKFTNHPQYDEKKLKYDIGIIKFNSAMTLGPKIQPIKLPKLGEEIPERTMTNVTGWSYDISPLQALKVPIISLNDCKYIYGAENIESHMLCVGYNQDADKEFCQSDKGAPLVVDGVLIGIASWGYGCAKPNNPGVYTNVAAFRTFIANVTGIE